MSKNKGFTLLEVIVALVLVLMSFLFIMSIFPLGSKALRVAENRQIAEILAKGKISELLHKDFADISSSYNNSFTYSAYSNGTSYIQSFIYDVNVSYLNLSLKNILIEVRWNQMQVQKNLYMGTMVVE